MTQREELLERLELPDALLSRTDVTALVGKRRAVDAIFKECAKREGVVILPGYSRPMVRVETYRAVIAECTYGLDRVWPT